jgi:PKD repeat protein
VKVPVTNVSVVHVEQVKSGQFRVEATPASATGSSIVSSAQDDLDMTVGVGQDIGVGKTSGTNLDLSNNQPTAKFTMDPGNPTNASNVAFTSKSSDPDGTITKYEWDFNGDGTVEATGESVTYSFSEPGRYSVNLTVTDDDGVTSSANKTVTVGGLVYRRDVSVLDADNDSVAESVVFNVTNVHKDRVKVLDLSINPEDDSIDTLDPVGVSPSDLGGNPVEIYPDLNLGPPPWAGGCGSPPCGPGGPGGPAMASGAAWAGTPPGGPGLDPNTKVVVRPSDSPVTFNDGGVILNTPSEDINPGRSFALVLSGFRDSGWVNMTDKPVTVGIRYLVNGEYYASKFTISDVVNRPPNPGFTTTCTDTVCKFNATPSYDPDGPPNSITSYSWSFSDGTTATGAVVNHTFPANGTYTATLTVKDVNGTLGSLKKAKIVGGVAFDLKVNVQPDGATVPAGYRKDNGSAYGPRPGGYTFGWVNGAGGNVDADEVRDRNASSTSQRYETLTHMGQTAYGSNHRAWKVDVPDGGRYRLYWVMGDPSHTDQTNDVTVGSRTIPDRDGEDNFDRYSTVVNATDTLTIEPQPSSDNAKLAFVEVEAVDTRPFDETSGQVVMEAEHYQRLRPGNDNDAGPEDGNDMTGVMWWRVEDSDASGGRGLRVDEDRGYNAQDTENGPRLDYRVDFDTTGTYYVWARMKCPQSGYYNNNHTIHVGLDGDPKTYGGAGFGEGCTEDWNWVNSWWNYDGGWSAEILSIDVSSPGVHTVNIWARQDGVMIDKVVLTKDSGFDPTTDDTSESDRK